MDLLRLVKNKGQQPYGTAAAKQIWYDKKYGETGHDWAVIKLDSAVGEKTGWFGMNVPDTQKLVDTQATVIGYPGIRTAVRSGRTGTR